MQLIWNLSIEGMIGAQSRSYPHSVPKVSTFTHHNKLTSRIVSKPLMGLTILNQALICTPIPSSMISQAFQAYYSIECCLSNCYILSLKRMGIYDKNFDQLNLLPRSLFTYSKKLHLQPQELLRWRQGPRRLPPINLHSNKYIRILQMLETQLKMNRKENFFF